MVEIRKLGWDGIPLQRVQRDFMPFQGKGHYLTSDNKTVSQMRRKNESDVKEIRCDPVKPPDKQKRRLRQDIVMNGECQEVNGMELKIKELEKEIEKLKHEIHQLKGSERKISEILPEQNEKIGDLKVDANVKRERAKSKTQKHEIEHVDENIKEDKEIQELKMCSKFLEFLERKDTRESEERKERMNERKENEEYIRIKDTEKIAIKYEDKIPHLSLEDLVVEENKGWKNLQSWIGEIQKYSTGNEVLRMHLARISLEDEILELINIDIDDDKWWYRTSWKEMKKKLYKIIPKVDISCATVNLLKDKWKKEENLTVFAMKVKKSYRQTCQLYDIKEIPCMSLERMMALRVTRNMNKTGQDTYKPLILRDPYNAIAKMEKVFKYNNDFKNSLFEDTEAQEEVQQDMKQETKIDSKDMRYKDSTQNYSAMERNKRCRNFEKGFCIFGRFCWYQHKSINKRGCR